MCFTQVSVTFAAQISLLSEAGLFLQNITAFILTAALYLVYVFRWAFKINFKFLSILLLFFVCF